MTPEELTKRVNEQHWDIFQYTVNDINATEFSKELEKENNYVDPELPDNYLIS